MKALLLSTLLAVGVSVSAVLAVDHDHATTRPATQPTTREAAAVNKFCAVETENPVDSKVTVVYKGKTIGFCCQDCVAEFNKNPEKYLAKMK